MLLVSLSPAGSPAAGHELNLLFYSQSFVWWKIHGRDLRKIDSLLKLSLPFFPPYRSFNTDRIKNPFP
jgi:hypothetical protein